MKRYMHEALLLLLLIGLLCAAGWLMPSFLKLRGQLLLSKHLWPTAIVAIAMTPVIITGGIDLSVGSTMGMCAVAFGVCYEWSDSLILSSFVCLLTGWIGGTANGLLISRLKVHPLIVTLATYAAFRGIAEGISQGKSYSQFGDAFGLIARGTLSNDFPLPAPAFLFVLLASSAAVWLTMTASGRFVYAIGHNEKAARYSGVNVDKLKFCLYAFSGLMAGLATLVDISQFDTAKADAGTALELDVITAVVIGGTSIFGGRGTLIGTTLGLLLIHEAKLFVGRYFRVDELKLIVVGSLLIVTLLINRVFHSRD